MTTIAEHAEDTRATRRIGPIFRLEGGAFPHGNLRDLPIETSEQEEQKDTGDRDSKEAHPTQASLVFPVKDQRHKGFSRANRCALV